MRHLQTRRNEVRRGPGQEAVERSKCCMFQRASQIVQSTQVSCIVYWGPVLQIGHCRIRILSSDSRKPLASLFPGLGSYVICTINAESRISCAVRPSLCVTKNNYMPFRHKSRDVL